MRSFAVYAEHLNLCDLVQELVPQSALGRGMTKLQAMPPAHLTPRTPNFQPPAPPANISPETLAKWAEIVAMMISSTISTDTSSAITALGDQLLANQYVEAAHAWFVCSNTLYDKLIDMVFTAISWLLRLL